MTVLSLVMLCLRVLVAAVFIAYAASKLHNPSSFAAVIRSHRLIPDALSSAAAWALIVVEMAVGLLFLFNVFPLLTGIAIGALLVLFSGVLLRARFTARLDVRSCGCSGVINQKATIGKALFRNVVLLCMLVPIVITTIASRSISPSPSPLIEAVIFICIIVWTMFNRTRIPGSASRGFLHLSQIRATRKVVSNHQAASKAIGRRSLLTRLGLIVGVGTLLQVFPLGVYDVFAGYCNCSCGPGGVGGPNCYDLWDCDGHLNQWVPYYRKCDEYCCQPLSNYCDSSLTYLGQIYCENGC